MQLGRAVVLEVLYCGAVLSAADAGKLELLYLQHGIAAGLFGHETRSVLVADARLLAWEHELALSTNISATGTYIYIDTSTNSILENALNLFELLVFVHSWCEL